MLFSTVTSFLASYLAALLSLPLHNPAPAPAPAPAAGPEPLRFELRHLHAVSSDARVLFHDVHAADLAALAEAGEPSTYALRQRRVKAHRPRSIDAFHRARVRSMRFQESEAVGWDEMEVYGPDVESRGTLLLMAKMTNNAYLSPGEQGWYELGDRWNVVSVSSA